MRSILVLHPPKFNSSPLKMDGWKTIFLLEWPIFRGYDKLQLGWAYAISIISFGNVDFQLCGSEISMQFTSDY